MELIVKTPIGLEKIAADRIKELDDSAILDVKPRGLEGLIIVESTRDKEVLAENIESSVPEVESVVRVEEEVRADLEAIAEAAVKIASGKISSNETFAVRTVRRGSHDFGSIDVNVAVGEAVRSATDASVNLDNPDKVLRVEIIFERAALCVTPGSQEWRKMTPSKRPATRLFKRVSVVQMPYLGSREGAKEIGRRVGRAVQAYEVMELVVAPNKPADAFELADFIKGVEEGVESRYAVQRRSYGREVGKVRVLVQDLYQLVRERKGEAIVVFEPEGLHLREASHRLRELMSRGERVSFLIGSREGIPKGVFRLASLVIDLAPGITLPTELAAPAALTAIYTALNMMGEAIH